jgi:hypothetical protein
LKERLCRIEGGNSSELSTALTFGRQRQQLLAGVARHVRAERVADDVERGRIRAKVLLKTGRDRGEG